jgi:GH24 family phage-related lysozyme (muramidase)
MTPLEKLLVVHEGLELRPYFDTAEPPRLTIGVGRNLSDVGLRDEAEALYLLRRDIDAIERELDRLWPLWRHLDDVRRDVVFSMAFNLGVAGFMAFKKTRQYLVEGRYVIRDVALEVGGSSRAPRKRTFDNDGDGTAEKIIQLMSHRCPSLFLPNSLNLPPSRNPHKTLGYLVRPVGIEPTTH